MDVGNPSNLSRLQVLYENDLAALRGEIDAVSISDDETLAEIKRTYQATRYVLDPHTAVGVTAAGKLRSTFIDSTPMIVTATAHPAKFGEIIRRAIDIEIPMPQPLLEAFTRPKRSVRLGSSYETFQRLLSSHP